MFPENLLVVDDNELLLYGIKRSLEKDFSRVEAVNTGEKALSHILNDFYRYIILDINLPDINGIRMLEKIKKSSPKSSVVMITSYADEETKQAAISSGALAVFEKPVDLGALKNAFLDTSF